VGDAAPAAPGSFMSSLKASLDQVNNSQNKASELGQSFEKGDPNVDLNDVMVAVQKANVSFQTAVQVRNRMVSAYHDIMNMQI
jgi:flagellar hook-basal body complex protein FliE